jgi:uncharacterized protein YjbI with pentapeptide repeats
MANEEHVAILRQGVGVWNEWRQSEPNIKPDLSSADFGKANLAEADLSYANLQEADLEAATLTIAQQQPSHCQRLQAVVRR